MSDNIRGKNVVIYGQNDDGTINKIKTNKDGELKVTFENSNNKIIELLESINNKLLTNSTNNNSNRLDKELYYGGNMIDYIDFNSKDVSKIINVENGSICNIFYEDDSDSYYNIIYVMGILDNYTYYEIGQIKVSKSGNYRKGCLLNLKIIGIKEIYLQNNSTYNFENAIASIYCY